MITPETAAIGGFMAGCFCSMIALKILSYSNAPEAAAVAVMEERRRKNRYRSSRTYSRKQERDQE